MAGTVCNSCLRHEGGALTWYWRLQIHFAEEWNELHHLQIMESLGGDQYWIDRFAAQHAAVFYYWVLVFFFAFSPELAYVFSELVEVGLPHSHACHASLVQAHNNALRHAEASA